LESRRFSFLITIFMHIQIPNTTGERNYKNYHFLGMILSVILI